MRGSQSALVPVGRAGDRHVCDLQVRFAQRHRRPHLALGNPGADRVDDPEVRCERTLPDDRGMDCHGDLLGLRHAALLHHGERPVAVQPQRVGEHVHSAATSTAATNSAARMPTATAQPICLSMCAP